MSPCPDPWLDRWRPAVRERADGAPVLELGCGEGRDTRTLVEAGLSVVALDLSPEAVARAREAVPGAGFHVQDLREPFPLASAGVVLASLSLHYFDWAETLALAARIRAVLPPGGLLLCRLNSTRDHHFGASGHPRIAEKYYLVVGVPKRFFDRPAVEALFREGWRALSTEEQVVERYSRPKVVWEVILERLP